MIYSKILGVGSFTPPRVLKNDDLRECMDTSDDWVQQRTGIKQRHWVEGTTTTSDLALEATLRALENAGVKKEELDMIILATLSPDHDFPGTACFLQAKLGVPGIPALDVRQQCSGFLYGMSIAEQFIKSGKNKKILLVGAEVHSKGLDRTTRGRDVAVLFGDGAGAVILGAAEAEPTSKAYLNESRLYSTHLHADGTYAKELYVKAPSMTYVGTRIPLDEAGLLDFYPQMNGKAVFVHAVKRMPEVLMEALKHNGLKIEDIDLFLFHQANLRINEMISKQLGIPDEKVFNTIDRFANTTAATIPIGMDEAVKAGKLKPGMLVASAAFGSGFTWASAIYRW